jgi:hypothetical protein
MKTMFGDTLAQEILAGIVAAIVVSVLAFLLGLVIRKGKELARIRRELARELAKVEKTKLSVFKVLSLPDDPANNQDSFFFVTGVVSSRAVTMPPLEFGTSGLTIKPYGILPEACDTVQESYPYAKSVRISCEERTSCIAMAGTVGGANVDPEDRWFGVMVVDDGMASTVIADFSSIEDFNERVRNPQATYWKNMTERAQTNHATLTRLKNNVFVGHVEAQHALKGHIVKIEFELLETP